METFNKSGLEPYYEHHHHAIARELGYSPEDLTFSDAAGGHMAYRRLFAKTPSGEIFFIKGQDKSLFTDDERAEHARLYLEKEHQLFTYLGECGYLHSPNISRFIDESYLLIEGLPVEEGWHWRAPRDNPELLGQYINDVLASFDALQAIPIPSERYFFPKRILKVYMEEGWDYLTQDRIEDVVASANILRVSLHPSTEELLDEALAALPELVAAGRSLYDVARPLYLSHHDARQANIAWHPEHGVRNIDLSWTDVGWRNADATMLLIDLAKAGHDVSKYMQSYFNPDHALLLMGHWFGRCMQPTRDGNPIVRTHQLASALTAFQLLNNVPSNLLTLANPPRMQFLSTPSSAFEIPQTHPV